jgi:hypothetical protein
MSSKQKRRRRAGRNRHFRIDHEVSAEDEGVSGLSAGAADDDQIGARVADGQGIRLLRVGGGAALAPRPGRRARATGDGAVRDASGRDGGAGQVGDNVLRGAALRAEQLILEAVFELRPSAEDTTPADVQEFADAVQRLIEIRNALADLEARVARSKGTGAEAPTESEEKSQRVAERVREILGGAHPRGMAPGNN